MKIIGAIHTFNTRRMYAANGQEIQWAVIERPDHSRVVFFNDTARGIDGVIDLHVGNLDLVDNDWVLRAYDDFHYHYGHDERPFFTDHVKLQKGAAKR